MTTISQDALTTTAFLKALFPLDGPDDPRAGEYVRFAVVDRAAQRFPGTVRWMTRAEIHALPDSGTGELPFKSAGCDVYVTPHPWRTNEHGQHSKKEHAAPFAQACWCELDDPDIDPANFEPPPSIVVRTSGTPEGGDAHHHLYWLLDKAHPIEVVEHTNRRLVYGNGLRADRGGWDITQWLRLPGSYSYKRAGDGALPYKVEVVAFDPARVYRMEDFAGLPAVPDKEKVVDAPLPGADRLPDAEAVRKKYPDAFTAELEDYLTRRHPDRSRALWRIYQICANARMTPEECYALVRGSANDKFSGYRYNGDAALWLDVRKGYQAAERPNEAPIVAVLRGIFARRAPKEEKRYEAARAVHRDLVAKGRFYYDPDRRMAYYFDGERVTRLDPKGHDWQLLLNRRYRLNPADDGFNSIHHHLYLFATEGERVTPRTLCWWDRHRKLLYVYRGDGRMYRLDGDAEPQVVENGADGVLFLDERVAPFRAEPDETAPSLEDAIFGLPNYVDLPTPHRREEAIWLAKLWFYSLFFAEQMDARPHLVATGDSDSGKAQPVDEPVLTDVGWRAIGQLRVGDYVIGSNGKPCRVLGVYPQGVRPVWKVTFSDGATVRCDPDHLWALATSLRRRRQRKKVGHSLRGRAYEPWTIREAVAKGITCAEGYRWYVPLVEPIQFTPADLPVDPYTLGVLIGDGVLTRTTTVCTRHDVVAHLKLPDGIKAVAGQPSGAHAATYRLTHGKKNTRNPLTEALRSLNLIGCRSWEKFIPHQYLHGSVEQRLELLRGIFDTDGSINNGTAVDFVTTSPKLARDVQYLVRSLGGTCAIKPKNTHYTKKNGDKVACRTAYRLHAALPCTINPFKVARKADLWRPNPNYEPTRRIVSVEPDGEQECVCIRVEAPDSLYVTNDFVLTHNTSLFTAIKELVEGEGARVDAAPVNRKEFEAIVSNARHVFFDNVDEEKGREWLKDALAEVATGIQFTRRVLFTTNDVATYRVQCHVGLTSRNEWFARTDVATRLVVLRTERRDLKVNPTTIFDAIRAHRNGLWQKVLDDLHQIVAAMHLYRPEAQELRMAGFGDFVKVAATALGADGDRLVSVILANQKETALDNAIAWTCLNEWLRLRDPATNRFKNNNHPVAITRLHAELKSVADKMGCGKDYEAAVPTPRALGQQIKELLPEIRTKCEVEIKKRSPANVYRFTLHPSELLDTVPTEAQEDAA